MKIASWNVNSLRTRLPAVLEWIRMENPDILCVQETKVPDALFPLAELKAAGLHAYFTGEKSYNGVAILSRMPLTDVTTDASFLPEAQRRFIAATYQDIRIINIYVPNGAAVDSEKYHYKLRWLLHLKQYLDQQLKIYPRLMVLGDFNIAPEDIDVHDPKAWEGQVLVSAKERTAFFALLDLKLYDAFRLLHPKQCEFTWWDYRHFSFRRHWGLRIDHILLSEALRTSFKQCIIDKTPRALERPSDHAPIFVLS